MSRLNLIKTLGLITIFDKQVNSPKLAITNKDDFEKVMNNPDRPRNEVMVIARTKGAKGVHNIPVTYGGAHDTAWVYSTDYLRGIKEQGTYNVEIYTEPKENNPDELKYYGLAVISKKEPGQEVQPRELKDGEMLETVPLSDLEVEGKEENMEGAPGAGTQLGDGDTPPVALADNSNMAGEPHAEVSAVDAAGSPVVPPTEDLTTPPSQEPPRPRRGQKPEKQV